MTPAANPSVDVELAVRVAVSQRRDDVRVEAVRPLRLEAGARAAITHTLNLSGGGLLLAGAGALAVGDRVSFRLDLGAERPEVAGEGVVVRAAADGRLGVRFEGMTERERDRIVAFVFERQRRDRKHGRTS